MTKLTLSIINQRSPFHRWQRDNNDDVCLHCGARRKRNSLTKPFTDKNGEYRMHAPKCLSLIEKIKLNSFPEPNTGCWLWAGHLNNSGYGRITIKVKTYLIHRIQYMIHFGKDIPDGLFVLHKCDVRCCVNPDHFFLGTPKDNMLDKIQKGRHKIKFKLP